MIFLCGLLRENSNKNKTNLCLVVRLSYKITGYKCLHVSPKLTVHAKSANHFNSGISEALTLKLFLRSMPTEPPRG